MMKIVIKRLYKTANTIDGCLYIDGEYFCDTLEPSKSSKRPKGCIPIGIYVANMSWSPHLKGEYYRLQNVTGFSGILIHSGNSYEDTMGCILLGKRDRGGHLIESKKTIERFYDVTKKGEIIIQIEQ